MWPYLIAANLIKPFNIKRSLAPGLDKSAYWCSRLIMSMHCPYSEVCSAPLKYAHAIVPAHLCHFCEAFSMSQVFRCPVFSIGDLQASNYVPAGWRVQVCFPEDLRWTSFELRVHPPTPAIFSADSTNWRNPKSNIKQPLTFCHPLQDSRRMNM